MWVTGCVTQQDRAYGVKTLELTDFGGHTELVVRHTERDQESKLGSTKSRSEETIFEESVSLETKGFVLHPNLFEFGLGGVFGLVQESFEDVVDDRNRDASNRGNLLEFDFDAQIFKKRNTPVTVFAHRRRGIIPRPFLPGLETTTTNYGLNWQYVSEKIPTSLQLSHTDVELSALLVGGGEEEEEGRQKSTELRFESAYNFSDHNKLSMTYNLEVVSEKPFELNYDANEVTLAHLWDFGDRHQHNLRSDLGYLDQRGTIDIERLRWREDLRLKHSDTLQSKFEFEALDRSYGSRSRDAADIQERSYYFSGSLRHQLFKSQTLQIRGYARKQEFETGLDVTRWGGQAVLNYHKTNRWGVLRANYAIRAERNDNRGTATVLEIIDELQTFRDPDPITLTNRNVTVSSITVRAEDRVTFYQRGRDFTVLTVGNVVEIRRVPTGRIADEEAVLVDYLFDVGGNFEIETVHHNFGIRQDFDSGVMPYYRFEWQEQSLSPAGATGAIAENITGHVIGMEYRKSSLRCFAEYEDHDSNINPFTSLRLGASYTYRFNSGAQTTFNSRWTETSHGAPSERDTKLFTVEGRYRHPITRNLTVEGSVLYRTGEDTFSDDTDGIDVSLGLEWLIRKTKVRINLERTEYEDGFASNDSSRLFIQVRREF